MGPPIPEFAGGYAPVSRAEWDHKIYEVTKLRKKRGRTERQSPAEAPQSSSSDSSTPSDEDEEQRKKRKARKKDRKQRKREKKVDLQRHLAEALAQAAMHKVGIGPAGSTG